LRRDLPQKRPAGQENAASKRYQPRVCRLWLPGDVLSATASCAGWRAKEKSPERGVTAPGQVLQVFVKGGRERTPVIILPQRANPLCSTAHINRDIFVRWRRRDLPFPAWMQINSRLCCRRSGFPAQTGQEAK
jgi:hypothetical protein